MSVPAPTSASGPPVEGGGRSLARNVSMLFASQIVTWSISLVLIVMVPRYLGPAAIGQYRIGEAIWAIAGVLSGFGTGTAISLAVARDRTNGPSLIAPVVLARLVLFAVVAAVATVLVVSGHGMDFGAVFVFLGVAMLLSSIGSVAAAALQGFEDLTLPARADIAYKLANAVAVVVALLLGANVAVVAFIAAGAAGFHTWMLHRYLRRYVRVRWRTDLAAAWRAARRGTPYFVGGVILVVYHQIDTIVLALLLDDETVGWYAAADRLVASTLFVPTVVMTALFPVLARLSSQSAEAAARLLDDAFRTLILLALPVGAGTIMIASPLTVLLFGQEFAEAGPVLAVFGVVTMIMFLTILLGQFAVATGRERFFFGMLGLATVATVPLDLVLVPFTDRVFANGAIGGALAYVVTETFLLVTAVAVLAPHLVNRATAGRLVRCVVAATLMALAVWPVRSLFPLVPVAVGVVVYGTALAVMRTFDDRELEAGRRLARRLRAARNGS
jgi:O-antigen/teichoic acid export membrane protein